MSHENVEIFRRTVEAINARDVSEALMAPDFRIENVVTAVTDKTYYGAAGTLEWLNDMSDAFGEGARYEVEEIIADGEDFVVGRVVFVGSGARSGAPLRLSWVSTYWFREGKITLIVGYATRREALEAVGLA
jgi:ketosteroid isomerase-like protein